MLANSRTGRSPGFTVVELLVTVAIVGILSGLLLTAIQMSRESARRTDCGNNLRQLGLAIHQFHDEHGGVPGHTGREPHYVEPPDRMDAWAWGTFILPYLEQGDHYDLLDTSVLPMDNNKDLLAASISTFRCASEAADDTQRFRESSTFRSVTVPLQNFGLSFDLPDRCRFRDVDDGLGRTILLGETVVSSVETPEGPLHSASTWCCALFGFRRFEELHFVYPGVLFWAGVVEPEEAVFNVSSSYHPGGAQVVMFDGSLRFISNQVEPKVLSELSELDDGMPVGDAWME